MHIVSGIIAGRNKGTIANCASNGILKITDNGIKSTYCGGITGQSMGIIENSYSKTNIEVTSNNKATINIGGIAGALTDSYVKFCYNTGDINIYINSDIKVMVGGITGYNEKTIENSYNIGTINIQSSCEITNSFLIGNIIGYLNGTDSKVANCFNIGKINMDLLKNNNSTSSIGNIIGSSYKGNMNNCYNTGFINNKNPELNAIGQIAGNLANTGIISNCLGIVENQINVIGSQSYNVSLNYVTLVEKNQIPDIMEVIGENFKPDNNINNGYPILNWQ